jgi:hypothetical protein
MVTLGGAHVLTSCWSEYVSWFLSMDTMSSCAKWPLVRIFPPAIMGSSHASSVSVSASSCEPRPQQGAPQRTYAECFAILIQWLELQSLPVV